MADAHALLVAKRVWRARGQGATKYRVSFINAAQGAVISLQEGGFSIWGEQLYETPCRWGWEF